MRKRSTQTDSPVSQCPIVGIGASAGGLDAFTQLIRTLAVDSDMAYVLVQHMDASHESLLPKLISKVTPMAVRQAEEGMAVEPNHIYVIPPNSNISVSQRRLHLTPRSETVPFMPVDFLFRSLAAAEGNKAIGVILSGTGSDGVLGLIDIKEHGGIVFAQDKSSAKFNGMPQSAVTSGGVDFVLSPEEIAKELTLIGCHPYVTRPLPAETKDSEPDDQKILQQIFGVLHLAKGVDFSFYKAGTFRRRLARRLAVNHIEGLNNYLDFLQQHPEEINALYKDVLIHVTRFFRDPDFYKALEKSVFPSLVHDRKKESPIRVWVPGCSTGEEVYSIGITLLNFLAARGLSYPIQLFATDLSDDVITKARSGQYLENIASEVPPDYLHRYFEKFEGGYKISKSVRDLCTFARHDLLSDPPFSRLDLISCRNLVIYWDPVMQKRILALFHYALASKGYLMLGSAESVRSFPSLFEPVDNQNQLYVKKPSAALLGYPLMPSRHLGTQGSPSAHATPVHRSGAMVDAPLEADQITRKLYSPPALLVNNELDIIQFRGRVSPYIGPVAGKASLHLLQMVSQALGQELSSLIDKARLENIAVQKSDLQIEIQGRWTPITVRVFPINGTLPSDRSFIIFFEEKPQASSRWEPGTGPERRAKPITPEAAVIENAHMRRQLFAIEAHLQSSHQKNDSLNEELRSAHEESLSTNEELQAGVEELETTKEELQSTNEELVILNGELKNSAQDAYEARDRSQIIVDTVRQPLLVLDPHLRVLQANKTFLDIYKTSLPMTENQLLFDLQDGQWNIPELRRLLENVLPQQQAVNDFEVSHDFKELGSRIMLLNARQISRSDGAPDRILLSMEDVTVQRESQKKLAEQNHDLKQLSDSLEVRVVERSRELALTQEALQQSRQLEAIGRLAGGVAHDFNNLMTGILGMAEDLKGQFPKEDTSQENLEEIVQAAKKACTLTKQLLAFGRRQVFAPSILNLNTVVKEMRALFSRFIGENTEIIMTLTPDLRSVRGDQSQLEQVMLNLVINSRDAMPRGGKVIIETANIELTPEMLEKHFDIKPGPYVRLTISDTGFGMNPETMKRIFEPFFTTKDQGKGTGLGLATTYGVVKQHEGDISVYSEPGQGTTFKIYLPSVNQPQKSERRKISRASGAGGTETILVVEDEDIVRRVVMKVLVKLGYRILEAKNGQEALDLVQTLKEPIDLLLTDVIMPGMDGRALATRLVPLQPSMAVLYMSGYPQDVIVRRGMLEAGISFIEKSFSSAALGEKVRNVLEQRKLRVKV